MHYSEWYSILHDQIEPIDTLTHTHTQICHTQRSAESITEVGLLFQLNDLRATMDKLLELRFSVKSVDRPRAATLMQKKCWKHSGHSVPTVSAWSSKFISQNDSVVLKWDFYLRYGKCRTCDYLLVFFKKHSGGIVQPGSTGACIRSQVAGLMETSVNIKMMDGWVEGVWREDRAACVRVSVSVGDITAAKQRPLCCCRHKKESSLKGCSLCLRNTVCNLCHCNYATCGCVVCVGGGSSCAAERRCS